MLLLLDMAQGDHWSALVMKKVLHILKSEPDETVAQIIDALAGDESVAVVNLYQDQISGTNTNWLRLVDDIFAYDQVICW